MSDQSKTASETRHDNIREGLEMAWNLAASIIMPETSNIDVLHAARRIRTDIIMAIQTEVRKYGR